MGKCGWRCMADTLTNVPDELQPASITAGRGGKQKDKFLGVTEAMASAGSPPTFSAYSDTICLISAEHRPTIWPTELAVSRLCNHKGGSALTATHWLSHIGNPGHDYSKTDNIPGGKAIWLFLTCSLTRKGETKPQDKGYLTSLPPASLSKLC